MRIFQFLQWVKQASPQARAQATQELALHYLFEQDNAQERQESEAALLLMCEDEAVLVRQTLAQTLAPHANAPLMLILTLLDDVPEVASPIIMASPLLNEQDLLALIARENEAILWAVAQRESFTQTVLARLFETVDEALASELLQDETLPFTPEMLDKLATRFPALHETLLAFDSLAPATRYMIAVTRGAKLAAYMPPSQANKTLAREHEKLALMLSTQEYGREALIKAVEAAQNLTPSLLLRALYCGNFSFLEAVFGYLSEISQVKIAAILREKSGQGIEALFYKAALPSALLLPFRVGLRTWHKQAGGLLQSDGVSLNYAVLSQSLTQFSPQDDPKAHYLLSQLCAEAAREEAKIFAVSLEAPALIAPEPELETQAQTLYIETALLIDSYQEEIHEEAVQESVFEYEFNVPEAVNDDAPTLLGRFAQERAA